MNKHLKYLSYVVRHKWFVFIWCLRLGVPIHRAILHDWTKFLPCEWFPYVDSFYGYMPDDNERRIMTQVCGYCDYPTKEEVRSRFNAAWNHHQKSNPHHWQYWVLTNDSDAPKHQALPMTETYIREMVADWIGAGRAITGKYEFGSWYEKNKAKQVMHPSTCNRVEYWIKKATQKV